jgi:hypothetical protein
MATGAASPGCTSMGSRSRRSATCGSWPIALAHDARLVSVQLLNHILADTAILCSLYKKHHWLMRGHTFYQLHLLLDKHAGEQIELIAERTPRAHPRRRRLTDATQGVLWHSCVSVLSVPAAAQGQPRCGNCKAFLPWIVDAVRRRGRRVGGRGRVRPGEGSPG